MSFTDTARHWLGGCALWTAASRLAVNVAMPHLRGKWPPTKAILRGLEVSFMRYFHGSHAPVFLDQSDAVECSTGFVVRDRHPASTRPPPDPGSPLLGDAHRGPVVCKVASALRIGGRPAHEWFRSLMIRV